MQRVLHIIGTLKRGGIETMVMNYYRNIDRTTIQFDFITFSAEKGDYDQEIRKLGGTIIPLEAKNSFIRMIKLYNFIKLHPEYNIVHCHVSINNAFHLIASKMAGSKVRISHAHYSSNNKTGMIGCSYEWIAKKVINRLATHKIACGKEASKYLYGSTENILILPNAVDVNLIRALVKESQKKLITLYDKDKLNILHVARFMPVKNHNFTLQLAEDLLKRNVNFMIYLVGDGPLLTTINKEIQDKNLSNHVKILGVRTDVIELMANADLMILPSLNEGFPVVLVESQASGLSALVSDMVAKEVDLGLDLVHFLPIDNAEIWVKKVMNFTKVSLFDEQIFNTLSQQGFDIRQNSIALQQLYESY